MTKPAIYVFSDLDDTLLQSSRKLPEGVTCEIGATNREGAPQSFFTNQQIMLLSMLERAQACMIPVTGRCSEALARVHYKFDSYAVVSHGAIVLQPGGAVCLHWLNSIRDEVSQSESLLRDICRLVQTQITQHALDARVRLVVDHGISTYLSIKGECRALDQLGTLIEGIETLSLHRNGRNMAFLPPYASKMRAVEYIQKRLAIGINDLVIAIGDSITDLPFMQLSQFTIVPVNSQIYRGFVGEQG